MVEMSEWGCRLYGSAGNLLTFVSFLIKTWGCGLSAVLVIVRKIQYCILHIIILCRCEIKQTVWEINHLLCLEGKRTMVHLNILVCLFCFNKFTKVFSKNYQH